MKKRRKLKKKTRMTRRTQRMVLLKTRDPINEVLKTQSTRWRCLKRIKATEKSD
jgi:hypothetical protein